MRSGDASMQDLEELRDELLSLEPGTPIAPRFHCPRLVELLLEDSEALQIDAPESAVFWADQAFALAAALRDKRFLASDGMARAARLKGNALRLEGDLVAANQAFALGLLHLGDASPERAWFCRALGVLRWEQDRLEEASSLLQQAAWLFSDSKNEVEEAVSLLLLGLLCAETSTPLRGLASLLHASAAKGSAGPCWLRLRCGFLKAALLGGLTACTRGRVVLDATMQLYSGVRDEGEILRACRLEGAARARLGDLEEGESLLEGVRRKQLARRDVQELTLSSLALAALLAVRGRRREVRRLTEELREAGLEPNEGGVFAVEALESLQVEMKQGARPWEGAARVSAEFLRLCRRFSVRLEPVPFF